MNLSKNVKVTQALGYFAAGQTKETSSIIDMDGYEGVMFVVSLGTLIQNGTLHAYLEENTANTTVGMVAAPTTVAAHTVSAGDAALTQSCIIYDVYQPGKQFVQMNITPATQNAVILGITAVQYTSRVKPPTADASVIASFMYQSPAEA